MYRVFMNSVFEYAAMVFAWDKRVDLVVYGAYGQIAAEAGLAFGRAAARLHEVMSFAAAHVRTYAADCVFRYRVVDFFYFFVGN